MSQSKAPWVLTVILFLLVGVQSARAYTAQRALQISEDNLAAAHDTTRTHLQDSLTASTRLAFQSDAVHDSLSGLLRTALADRSATGAALQILQVRFDSVRTQDVEPVFDTIFIDRESGDTTRVATFRIDGPPISGEQTVRFDGGFTLDSRLKVSPFTIKAGLGCSGPTPVFAWESPAWVSVGFERGFVSPDVCRLPIATPILSISTGKTVWLAAGVLIGFFAAGGGR